MKIVMNDNININVFKLIIILLTLKYNVLHPFRKIDKAMLYICIITNMFKRKSVIGGNIHNIMLLLNYFGHTTVENLLNLGKLFV